MTLTELIDLDYLAEEALQADCLEEAVIGANTKGVLVYDVQKILDILVKTNDWSLETAQEWFDYNIDGTYMGEHTPIYIYT